MSLHQHESLFAAAVALLIDSVDDDVQLAKALASLLDRAGYFDIGDVTSHHAATLTARGVDLDAVRAPKAKRWSVDKLGRHLMEQLWQRANCQSCIDWFLVLGWTLAAEERPIDKLRTRRDLGKMRLLAADACSVAPAHRSEFDVLAPGPFADWWLQPLLPADSPQPPPDELEAHLAHLESMPPWAENRPDLDDLASAGPDGWLESIIAAGEHAAPRLLALIDLGAPHRALLAAVLLYHAVRKQRNTLPLSSVAVPLYELCDRGLHEIEAAEFIKDTRWGGLEIMPRGDLWEWVRTHLDEYVRRLEPWLVSRLKQDVEQRRCPDMAFHLLDELVYKNGALLPGTHAYLMDLAEQFAAAAPDFHGWFDPRLLLVLYQWPTACHYVTDEPPAFWPQFLEATERAIADGMRASADAGHYPHLHVKALENYPRIGGELSATSYDALSDLVDHILDHAADYHVHPSGLLHELFEIYRRSPDLVPARWDELRAQYAG